MVEQSDNPYLIFIDKIDLLVSSRPRPEDFDGSDEEENSVKYSEAIQNWSDVNREFDEVCDRHRLQNKRQRLVNAACKAISNYDKDREFLTTTHKRFYRTNSATSNLGLNLDLDTDRSALLNRVTSDETMNVFANKAHSFVAHSFVAHSFVDVVARPASAPAASLSDKSNTSTSSGIRLRSM